nr:BTB and MATH domain-containing protein 47-like isoform X4 [Crassostrea gigas]
MLTIPLIAPRIYNLYAPLARMEAKKQSFDIGFPDNDVILLVEGQKFHVNKAVLSDHSPVFNTMLNKESTAKEIVLEDKKAVDVVEFLKSFYPNMKHPITGANVLQVLTLAHEYQSPLVADCENFMIIMCTPKSGVRVSTLLDYILAGEKYGLTRFLEAAVEFCAKIDFDFLTGKKFLKQLKSFKMTEDLRIYSKFSNIDMKTRYAIAMKRVQHLEMNRRKLENSQTVEDDYKIPLS